MPDFWIKVLVVGVLIAIPLSVLLLFIVELLNRRIKKKDTDNFLPKIPFPEYGIGENLELIQFSKLPLGEWFRINIGGKPGCSQTKKTYEWGGRSGSQLVELGDEPVWWIKDYVPGPDQE